MSSVWKSHLGRGHDIRSRTVIVFDWFDGPREGVCALEAPRVEFAFGLLDERPREDDLDERLFLVKELEAGTVGQLVKGLECFGEPDGVVWVPRWSSPDPEVIESANRLVDQVIQSAVPTRIVVMTSNMQEFTGCWEVDDARPRKNWFSYLRIAP